MFGYTRNKSLTFDYHLSVVKFDVIYFALNNYCDTKLDFVITLILYDLL